MIISGTIGFKDEIDVDNNSNSVCLQAKERVLKVNKVLL